LHYRLQYLLFQLWLLILFLPLQGLGLQEALLVQLSVKVPELQ